MGHSDFELAAQLVPASTTNWFLVRFDVKPGGNLVEDQKQTKQGLYRTLWCVFCRDFRW